MKLNTRLIIIFFAVIFLPFILAATTFFVICGSMVWNLKHAYGVKDVPLSAALSPAELYSSVTENYMDILKEKLEKDNEFYKNAEEISEIDSQLSQLSSFVIIKGEEDLYYIGKDYEEDEVLNVLPAPGILPPEETASLYYNDIHRVVKLREFVTAEGIHGTIYIVTCVSMIISDVTSIGVIISIIVVLTLTGILLTSWLNQGIIKPMISLKSAMMRIEQGDLETPATTAEKGEVGELFEGFEKMRVRLKDSEEEKIKTEAANKELISNISHDLKTPITSIKGYVEGIMDGVADTPEKWKNI
ncbi:MAG: HAMP domain-containing protein [Lachnospiraceae bacterium]|nr:HAMP domain-containing protein [Lachnospiraceae bacterium]